MLGALRKLIPDLKRIEDYPILRDGKVVGHHSIVFREGDVPFGGGCGQTLERARRIAVAECIERALFLKLKEGPHRADFLIDEYPTSCGFAAGFESSKTKFRAIFETLERWNWSKWIDSGFKIPRSTISRSQLSAYSQYFYDVFDEVLCFDRDFELSDPRLSDVGEMKLRIAILVCVKDGGVFPGSRVGHRDDDLYSHGLVEAWRHWMIFQNYKKTGVPPQTLIDQRIMFFGENSGEALRQIDGATQSEWPSPRLRLLREYVTAEEVQKYFLWRAVCADYVPWDQGAVTRFIY